MTEKVKAYTIVVGSNELPRHVQRIKIEKPVAEPLYYNDPGMPEGYFFMSCVKEGR